MSSDVKRLTDLVIKFRNDRNWKQFHNPKDVALSLVLEATEVMEHFQWKNGLELEKYIKEYTDEIGDELSDVLYWVLLMSHDLNIDIVRAFQKKLRKTARKYPVKRSKGISTKYTKL